jgi:hypothetical protein
VENSTTRRLSRCAPHAPARPRALLFAFLLTALSLHSHMQCDWQAWLKYVWEMRAIKSRRLVALCSSRKKGELMNLIKESMRSHRSATASHAISDFTCAASIVTGFGESPFPRLLTPDYTARSPHGVETRRLAAISKSLPPRAHAPCTDSTADVDSGRSMRVSFAMMRSQGKKYADEGALSVGHAVIAAAAVCFPPYNCT